MEQFRQMGEVLGSMKAVMVLQEIPINPRQCGLIFDIFTMAFNTIAEEIKQNLKLEEKNTKWKGLEEPFREVNRVFKEGEVYVRRCLDNRDWWGKAISLHQNNDSVEFHIHNLLSCFPVLIEAIEIAGEISGLDQEVMHKKRQILLKKYDSSWNDPTLFQWRFGKQYLVPQEMIRRIESVVREDCWFLVESIKEKKKSGLITKNESRLGDLLTKKLNHSETTNGKLAPSSILVGSEDYQVRRRLGGGGKYKEIQWLGESFAMRHFFEDIEPFRSEISTLFSLSHPNIVQYLCGFYDEEKKECFLVMELMSKDLFGYMRENSSPRRRILFPLAVLVDIMFQVSRGMEFLHSRKIFHGNLNPTNVFLKPRKFTEGFFHVKVSGFALPSIMATHSRNTQLDPSPIDPCIWFAPEVLSEQESTGNGVAACRKHSEKADVYSFGMICFQLLTGKLPFEDGHLHGNQMIKNIRAGERPLFPFISPKYLVNLTKKCWHADPNHRPSFSSISRVLRYVKKFLIMNPNEGQPDVHSPPVDYSDLEVWFLKHHQIDPPPLSSLSQIPFQIFAYKLAENEKTCSGGKVKNCDSGVSGYEDTASVVEDPTAAVSDARSVCSDMKAVCFDMKSVCTEVVGEKKLAPDLRSVYSEPPDKILPILKNLNSRPKKSPGTPRAQSHATSSHGIHLATVQRSPRVLPNHYLKAPGARPGGGHWRTDHQMMHPSWINDLLGMFITWFSTGRSRTFLFAGFSFHHLLLFQTLDDFFFFQKDPFFCLN